MGYFSFWSICRSYLDSLILISTTVLLSCLTRYVLYSTCMLHGVTCVVQVGRRHRTTRCMTAPPMACPSPMACPLGVHQGGWIAPQASCRVNIKCHPRASYHLRPLGACLPTWVGASGRQACPPTSGCPLLDPYLDPNSISVQV